MYILMQILYTKLYFKTRYFPTFNFKIEILKNDMLGFY